MTIVRLHSWMTLPQARGRVISTLLRNYSAAEIAERLRRLDPQAELARGASARSLASKLAWRLLPGALPLERGTR